MKTEMTTLLFVYMLIIAKQRIQLCLEKYLFYARSWDRGIWCLCMCVRVFIIIIFLRGDACNHSVHSFFSYLLLVQNVEIKIHKTVIWLLF